MYLRLFTGYVVDLARYISDYIRAEFRFELVPDETYGTKVNGTWDGMVGQLVSGVTVHWVCILQVFCTSLKLSRIIHSGNDSAHQLLTVITGNAENKEQERQEIYTALLFGENYNSIFTVTDLIFFPIALH